MRLGIQFSERPPARASWRWAGPHCWGHALPRRRLQLYCGVGEKGAGAIGYHRVIFIVGRAGARVLLQWRDACAGRKTPSGTLSGPPHLTIGHTCVPTGAA